MATMVTGGTGWVPIHVVRRLAKRGEQVIVVDLSPPDEMVRECLGDAYPNVVFEIGDVTDRERLAEICRQTGVLSMIHAAAITPRFDREQREPERIVDVNYHGTVNVLEVARGIPGFRRFVYVSSCAVWGEQPAGTRILDESSPANATTLYGITKLASERTTLRYGELFDMDVVAVRPANVYGPMERFTPGYIGATQLREMLRIWAAGETVRVNSAEGPWLDWTYVEDIAEGIERVWSTPQLQERVLSITGGALYSIGDVLSQFERHLPEFAWEVASGDEVNYVVDGQPPGPVPSNATIARELGWIPQTTFEHGMAEYLSWIQRHGPQ